MTPQRVGSLILLAAWLVVFGSLKAAEKKSPGSTKSAATTLAATTTGTTKAESVGTPYSPAQSRHRYMYVVDCFPARNRSNLAIQITGVEKSLRSQDKDDEIYLVFDCVGAPYTAWQPKAWRKATPQNIKLAVSQLKKLNKLIDRKKELPEDWTGGYGGNPSFALAFAMEQEPDVILYFDDGRMYQHGQHDVMERIVASNPKHVPIDTYCCDAQGMTTMTLLAEKTGGKCIPLPLKE